MAEIIVSAAVTVLIEKLLSGDLMKLARSEGIDSQLKKLKKNLDLIEAVLADASQKHITQRSVRLWLHELQDLAYDIDDVLDDMATENIRRKLNQESQASTSTSKLLKIMPTCCTTFTPHNMMYGRNMRSNLDEITSRLDDLVAKIDILRLVANVTPEIRSNGTNLRLLQTSLVDESTVLGREGDKEELLEKLLEVEACKKKFSVVSIVGLGGIGKTTLAKILYNDKKVKDQFELRAWVCVAEEFDVFSISKAIYQAVDGYNKDFATLELLHVALQEKLSRKRFLIVLDDVWNEDHNQWEPLRSLFDVGCPGSKIIVTTRKTKVASVMDSVQPYSLKVLSDEIALSLFAYNALNEENFDRHPSLKSIAQGIIKKCNGLPLALVSLGRVLKTKGTNVNKWEKLLNSEIWNLEDPNGILPALNLSYYDLPLHLKQLFAYCSLFPKDYEFNKDELVLLWMAEGFLRLQSKDNNTMESMGHNYFEDLTSRSFFQNSADDELKYTMHDLIHDLAISVAGEFFYMLDDKMDLNVRIEALEKFRHFSFIVQLQKEYRKLEELCRPKRLRTFLPVSIGWQYFSTSLNNILVNLFPGLQFLRVLSLTHNAITEVPQFVGDLKHLRYLNFSETIIKQVPQVSELYNLQSLLVRNCQQLSSLPVNFVKLKNLRHLDMSNTPLLSKTPLEIGGLTSLQTLTKVIIDGANGFKVSELKDLLNLQGHLSIKGLDKVIVPQQAFSANLQQKKGLVNLELEWSDVFNDSRKSQTEYEVIEGLRPDSMLKMLRISCYGGMKFPSWVGDSSFNQLTELTLEGCRSCTQLPTLGHLSSLKKLYVRNMDGVKEVGYELIAPIKSKNDVAFPSLEYLEVDDMKGLETWSTSAGENDGSFPCLLKIRIERCPKLADVSIGLIPLLEYLYIDGCCESVFRAMVGVSSSIRKLKMKDIEGLIQLKGDVSKHLTAVEHLHIYSCNELIYLWDSESDASRFLVRLKKLKVYNCKKLVSMGEKGVNVNVGSSIRHVTLDGCDSLESYNCPNSVENLFIVNCCSMTSLTLSTTLHLQDFPSSLKTLIVYNCKNLKSFSHEHLQSLKSLEELGIVDCESMDDSFPCGLWPSNLRILGIGELKKPMLEWGLQNYPSSLVDLTLFGKNSGVESFAMEEDDHVTSSTSSFLLPPSLTSLLIKDFKDVKLISNVLQHLPYLQQLDIISCLNLRDVPHSTSSLTVYVDDQKR